MSFVPWILEETKNGLISKDIVTALYDSNIIMISWPIQMGQTDLVVAQLLYLMNKIQSWNAVSNEITIYLNTPGWEVYSWMWIIDTMLYIQNQWIDIIVINIWIAASMWSLILTAWTKWKRFLLPNSVVMIHQPLWWAQWQATDIQIQAEEILRIKKNINQFISERTWQPIKKVQEATERDNYLDAKSAIEFWLADKTLE